MLVSLRVGNSLRRCVVFQQEFDACVERIDQHFESNVVSEYPLYLKALIERQRGASGARLRVFPFLLFEPTLTPLWRRRARRKHSGLAAALSRGHRPESWEPGELEAGEAVRRQPLKQPAWSVHELRRLLGAPRPT